MLFYITIGLLIIIFIGITILGLYLHHYEKKYGWNIKENDANNIYL